MAIRTIFSMAEDCARGERLGWMEFVRDFAEIARSLVAHYFPALIPDLEAQLVGVFRRAGAQGGAWFTGLSFSNEREFMMAFRDLVFACGREQARLLPQRTSESGSPAQSITLDPLRAAMQDLMLLEREVLWLFIKGHDAQHIAGIMMNAAATAEAVQRVAGERLRAVVPEDSGTAAEGLTRSAPLLMEMAEQSKTDACVSLKSFNNLVNGQLTWRERELAEEHMAGCFYCIDRFTTFQELIRLRKDTPPLAPPQVDAILAQLPLAAGNPRGVLSRLFAGR
jgi:hypothetical protein